MPIIDFPLRVSHKNMASRTGNKQRQKIIEIWSWVNGEKLRNQRWWLVGYGHKAYIHRIWRRHPRSASSQPSEWIVMSFEMYTRTVRCHYGVRRTAWSDLITAISIQSRGCTPLVSTRVSGILDGTGRLIGAHDWLQFPLITLTLLAFLVINHSAEAAGVKGSVTWDRELEIGAPAEWRHLKFKRLTK